MRAHAHTQNAHTKGTQNANIKLHSRHRARPAILIHTILLIAMGLHTCVRAARSGPVYTVNMLVPVLLSMWCLVNPDFKAVTPALHHYTTDENAAHREQQKLRAAGNWTATPLPLLGVFQKLLRRVICHFIVSITKGRQLQNSAFCPSVLSVDFSVVCIMDECLVTGLQFWLPI